MCDHIAYCERNELKAENDRLRAELERTTNLATHDYMNGQAELSAVRAELAEAKARIAELEGLLAYGTDTSEYQRIRARAELAEEQLIEAYAGANLLAADVIRFRDRQLAAEARAERAEAELKAVREGLA